MIDITIDTDGIATLSWDQPGRAQNVLNGETCAAFFTAIDKVVADANVKGILITSAKPDFIAGGDLEWLQASDDAATLFDRTCELHRALRKLETCGKPVAAALPGSTLGGGLEIALACHYRVAADNARARFGLPEVTLGLLPGGGGTQRLPRLIGVQKALPMLLEGKRIKAAEALKLGIVDAVVNAGEVVDAARAWLLGGGQNHVQQPWDIKGYKVPGGGISSPAVQQIFTAANAMLRQKTYGNYPAAASILSCVYEGLITDLDTGLKTEARYFVQAVLSPEARAMIRTLFFSLNAANKLAARPTDVPVRRYAKVGVLGAGMMGAGIAYVTAKAGLPVVLLDSTQEAAERGKDYSRKLVEKQVQRGRLHAEQAEALLARIKPTTRYTDLDGAELVIEAVFEQRDIKADVTRQAEAVLSPDAIFASNTSTLPITGLAEASSRPGNFIGLHFFSPVDKMPLVEVIVARQTTQATLAQALDYVKAIGMTPIVVNDSRGFYTSRVFSTYVLEGLAMLAEGVAPALIENAGVQAGMPVGPLALIDEVSSELIHKVNQQTRADLGVAYIERPGEAVAERMVALGRIGRKAGQGFYDYPEGGKKALWPGLATEYPKAATQPNVQTLVDRLVTVQAVETARCLDERVVTDPRDADVGALLGWGFPAFRGGPVSHIHRVGVGAFVALCDQLADEHGRRFTPPALLRDMAARQAVFYER
ncbi:3-hydroxyacyl-CoA dehydrogenase NAD-binding domain-containing protein [Ralstonia insidiosa]|jgi:3-hydroxyacyl-CoA dehydrogenase/enoyl-CoA hydratase/3-hydroxybutyryl-CoA epimerase|nr:3-hydroxyacyl-CoA dehydrogenase NAD-binding domain-containing protein [Ralstonia insidiosa]KMW45605.1 3-hydroxyacyl-CoA dehydrogenase [Ralstonia sp. MD27]MBX3772442.1 enoyl-CoA hydratase/isomerase family protein [Ralstonia pickettii]NOZ15667.1 3-hydroxyacyl-CoA dehydrogenase [Betaproteobacteria bacterium]MBA9857098.1 3-hydroxyacyl-CoA dehydrogenase [Ralstonia insidiosa]MBA9870200.1 3-hydroxyacyl-CoA dehydrogenase [Ralstonia insidiosa]